MNSFSISSRDFTGRVAEVKRQTANGPVVITARGKAAHVLMSFEQYLRLTNASTSLADALAMPEGQDIDFDPPKATFIPRLPDLEQT